MSYERAMRSTDLRILYWLLMCAAIPTAGIHCMRFLAITMLFVGETKRAFRINPFSTSKNIRVCIDWLRDRVEQQIQWCFLVYA